MAKPSFKRDLILVITPDWSAFQGELFYFQQGVQRGAPLPVVVGKEGMAWGKGLHEEACLKREGDGKSPAGIFELGTIFGTASAAACGMPYLMIDEQLEWVDDPHSRYYNLPVRGDGEKDWKSSEKMSAFSDLYKWGIEVRHNCPPEPHLGSCIFMHIWRSANLGTEGCTAMREEDLYALIQSLDSANPPLLIQLPREEYLQRRVAWDLPLASNAETRSRRDAKEIN
jgi:zinc D-Ala-D-Ala dipeptidase